MAFRGCDPVVLRDFLRESGLSYDENTKSYIFQCPRCKRARKLFISKRSGRFVCWRCAGAGYKGRPEYALADLLGQRVKDIQARLYGGDVPVEAYLHVVLDDFYGDGDVIEDEDFDEVPVLAYPEDYYLITTPDAARGAQYLAGRGIPARIAAEYGIHYSLMEQRVVFPIAESGRLYGWQGRLVTPTRKWVDKEGNERESLKIKTSKNTPRERLLMFVDRLRDSPHAVLCEGPVDALKAHYCGGNVCAMGKNVSTEQLNLIIRSGVKKLYLALDPDAAEQTMRIIRRHFDDVELYQMVARTTAGKPDLGAMELWEVYELFLDAKRVGAGHLSVFLNPRVIGH